MNCANVFNLQGFHTSANVLSLHVFTIPLVAMEPTPITPTAQVTLPFWPVIISAKALTVKDYVKLAQELY